MDNKDLSKLQKEVQNIPALHVNLDDNVFMRCHKVAQALGKQMLKAGLPSADELMDVINRMADLHGGVTLRHITAVAGNADLMAQAEHDVPWVKSIDEYQLWHIDDGEMIDDVTTNWLVIVTKGPQKYAKSLIARYWNHKPASRAIVVYWPLVNGYDQLFQWVRETYPLPDSVAVEMLPNSSIKSYQRHGEAVVSYWAGLDSAVSLELTKLNRWFDMVNDIQLTIKRNKQLAKAHRALPNMTKKNINKETMQAMHATCLQKYFADVELDNAVDLDKFKQFSDELLAYLPSLPALHNPVTLRLRKLRNYKALGMFYPSTNDLVVDFRVTEGQAGIDSFTHEYGHAIDHDNGDLSLQPLFESILRGCQRSLADNHVAKYDYLATPTECFARAFEVWQAGVNHVTTLVDSMANYQNNVQYQYLCSHLQELDDYFKETIAPLAKVAVTSAKPADNSDVAPITTDWTVTDYQQLTLF